MSVPREACRSSVFEQVVLWLWSLYLPLGAFYVFPSGIPQPADFLIVLLFGLVICGRAAVPKHLAPMICVYAIFVAYTVVVSFTWGIQVGDNRMLVYPLYYAFNLLGMLVVAVLFQWHGQRFVKTTVYSIVVSILLQLGISLVATGSQLRSTNYFNNPNQLGYYVLLMATIYTAVAQSRYAVWPTTSAIWSLGFFGVIVKLVVHSLSRAAIGATGIVIALAVFSKGRYAVVATIVAVVLAVVGIESEFADSVWRRFESRRLATEDELEYRGYERIERFPQYLILGAGEGAYHRFGSYVHNEIHSLFGNLLFSYGAIGMFLFAGVFFCMWRSVGMRPMLLLAPPMAYSVVHNGIRQFELWLLVVMIAGMFHQQKTPPKKAQSAPRPLDVPTPVSAASSPIPPRTRPALPRPHLQGARVPTPPSA